jgi:SAM-dependent methyltransferase
MDITSPKTDLERAFAPAIRRRVSGDDAEWNKRMAAATPRLSTRLVDWLQRTFLKRGVEGVYEEKWSNDKADALLRKRFDMTANARDPMVWGEERFFAHPRGAKRVHLLYLIRLIETIKPRTVLEVGSGTGANLFILAALFPDISFSGIELTSAGYNTAKEISSRDTLPQPLADFSPVPIRDPRAHQRVSLHQGNAKHLPFPPGSFDLVYTVQALEQMEAIREEALQQIESVSRGYVAMIEPFADFNVTAPRRYKISSARYFSASVKDLLAYGLKPVFSSDNMPSKLTYGIGMVVAQPTRLIPSGP